MKKAKNKKRKQSEFPHFLTLIRSNSNLDSQNVIITDAGADKITYELALKYLTVEEIHDWWESLIDFDELEDEQIEAWEKVLPDNFSSLKVEESLNIIQTAINNFVYYN